MTGCVPGSSIYRSARELAILVTTVGQGTEDKLSMEDKTAVTTGLGHSNKAMDRVVEVLSMRVSGVTMGMVDVVLTKGEEVTTIMEEEVTNRVMVDEVTTRVKVSTTMLVEVTNKRCRIIRVRVEEVFTKDQEIWVFRA